MSFTVVIEGCDRLGKSTLVEQLSNRLMTYKFISSRIVQKHFGYPPKELTKEEQAAYQRKSYEDQVAEINAEQNRSFYLFDRFMIGEKIYGPKYRGYSPDYIEDLEQELDIDNTFLFVLTADPEVPRSRYDGDFIKYEDIEWLINQYVKCYNESKTVKKYMIDVSRLSIDDVFNIVWRELEGPVESFVLSSVMIEAARNLHGMQGSTRAFGEYLEREAIHIHNYSLSQLTKYNRDLFDVSLQPGLVLMDRNGVCCEQKEVVLGKLVNHDIEMMMSTIQISDERFTVHGKQILKLIPVQSKESK